jgi:hypothetical protein
VERLAPMLNSPNASELSKMIIKCLTTPEIVKNLCAITGCNTPDACAVEWEKTFADPQDPMNWLIAFLAFYVSEELKFFGGHKC